MTLRGILNAAHGLSYYSRLQEVTANNLANVSTDGFKVDRMTGQMTPGTSYPVPVQHLDLAQGGLRETGRELDVALNGPGFLVVKTPQGERLTRGGSLHLDPAGQLVDPDGNPIMGTKGAIVLTASKVEIQSDGTVRADDVAINLDKRKKESKEERAKRMAEWEHKRDRWHPSKRRR